MRDGTSRGTPSTRSVRTTARRSSCTPNTEPAFATVDSWTDSSRRVKRSGSCPLTSTSKNAPYHQLATREPLADARVSEHRDWCASRPASSARFVSVQMAWSNPRRRLPGVVAGYETKDATAFRDELRERPRRTSAVRSVRTRTFVSARKRQTGRMSSGGTTAPTVGTKPLTHRLRRRTVSE